MPKNRVILAACPPPAFPTLKNALGGYVELVHVDSLYAAETALQTDSRIEMILNLDISRSAREALRIAAESLGANAYLDFPSLEVQHGRQDAEVLLRRHVLARLPHSSEPA